MWNSSNSTVKHDGTTTRVHYIPIATSLTVIGVLTLSANIILIITLLKLKSKHLKPSTRLFLMYKSLGHAFHGIGVMVKPYIGYSHCVYFGGIARIALGTVITGMLLLSIDSFITITKPFRHHSIMTPRVAKFSVLLSFLFVLMLQLISALVPSPLPKVIYICTQNSSQVDPWVLLILSLIGALVMSVAMGLQGYNIWILWKRSINVPPASHFVPNAVEPVNDQPQNTSNNNRVTRLDRLQRLLTVWVISIFVCWMPICIIIALRAVMDIHFIEMPVLVLVQPYFSVLPLIDGVLQPCLAVALSQEIRSGIRKLFCCCFKPDNNGNNGRVVNNVIEDVGVSTHVASHI